MRLGLVATAVSISLISLSAAQDARAVIREPIAIPAQQLERALQALAKDRDFQIIYRSEIVGTRQSKGASGNLTSAEALTELLSETGLTFQYLDDHTVTILPLAVAGRQKEGALSATESSRDGVAAPASARDAEKGAQKPASFWGRFRVAQVDRGTTARDGTVEKSGRASESNESEKLEEITVTAQKRLERLQDVPISISVLSGKELDEFTGTGVTEALRTVPGVATTVHNQGGGTQISVRGVAANRAVFGSSSPIAYYLDSSPFGFVRSAAAPDSSAYDLSRVEVLRGPQGTLYGSSALNGVVRVLTHDVDLEKVDFKARTSWSGAEDGDSSYGADAAVNIPFIEGVFGGRAVLGYQDIGGWIDKANNADANDAQIGNYRLRLRAQPAENLTLGLSTWFSRSQFGAAPTSRDDRTSTALADEPLSVDYDLYSLTIGYDFPSFSLASTTSSLSYDNAGVQDLQPIGIGSQLFTGLYSDVVTQEVNLTSMRPGAWRWTAGAIYRDGEDRVLTLLPGVLAPSDSQDRSKSFAVFAELTRLFREDRLELTAGLRYFEDSVRHTETVPVLYGEEEDFDKVSPRFALTWHASKDKTFYASFAEGFRSGSLQLRSVMVASPAAPSVKPDTLSNYEIGSKGSWLDGRLRYDAALYYVDWQDVQMNLSVLVNGVPTSALTNGDSASGVGFDFSLSAEPVEGLDLGLTLGWNDLSSDTTVFWTTGAGSFVLLEKGDRLNYSPELTASATLGYTRPIGSGYEGILSAGATYMSRQDFHNVVGTATLNYAGDSVLVARTGFTLSAPSHWRATLFADNLFDEDRPLIGATFGNPNNASHVRPRTIGLQLDYQFGRR
jgi:iron complex outermembrane recepter protein